MRLVVFIVAALLMGGCSTRFVEKAPQELPQRNPAGRTFSSVPPMEEVWLPGQEAPVVERVVAKSTVRQTGLNKLYAFEKQWHHTPYRYGGSGLRGMDCSAFTQRAYWELFGIGLPRTTHEQVRCGSHVTAAGLRAGDLVFFRTGGRQHHVGIYLDHGRFMHVSTKFGVMISHLEKPYWKRHYWTTRRIK